MNCSPTIIYIQCIRRGGIHSIRHIGWKGWFIYPFTLNTPCKWHNFYTAWCLGPRVQILHSAEEHNLSPFDLNIACLCQSIEINNNKYVNRQSQVQKSTDSGVKWAECSLIIGTGCRVQGFSDLVSSSNPAFSRGTQLVSFWFEYRLPVPEHRN